MANGTIIIDEIVWASIAERSRLMIAYGTSENTVTKISKTARDLNVFVMQSGYWGSFLNLSILFTSQ